MIYKYCLVCGKKYKTKMSHFERRRTCSIRCMAKYYKYMMLDENNPNFGNRWATQTPFDLRERASSRYKKWRTKVLERDSYACVLCGSKENLNADHIKPFSIHKELRFELSNGRTLCVPCHKKTDTYGTSGRRAHLLEEQL